MWPRLLQSLVGLGLVGFGSDGADTAESWAVANHRCSSELARKRTDIPRRLVWTTRRRLMALTLPPQVSEMGAKELAECQLSRSSRSRTSRPPRTTLAPTLSCPRAERRPPTWFTRAASRTGGGSRWRSLRNWPGPILSSSRYWIDLFCRIALVFVFVLFLFLGF